MRAISPITQNIPLGMVGGCKFGRYPKISLETTYNMIISDGWLVPFAGYLQLEDVVPGGIGRGIYASGRFNKMIAVINAQVFAVNVVKDSNGNYIANAQLIAQLATNAGDVFIAENNGTQIAICDKLNIYIFDYQSSTFTTLTETDLGFSPGYMEFQDTYFISIDQNDNEWRLSNNNNGLIWPNDANHVGLLQTKPDTMIATVRFPGKGNLLYVMGRTVTEQWYDTGAQLFPYQRSSYSNIDFGCLNASTIAGNDEMVVWLGSNEKSGPVIMYSMGGDSQRLSNDGIDFLLANLKYPDQSFASLFRQDGHLIYMITFYNYADNFTLIYDFNTQLFSFLTDDKRNCHIAKKIVFFNDAYFFVSHVDGGIYQISSNFYSGNGLDIPRIRTTRNIRLPDANKFVVNNINFTLEQGMSQTLQEVHLSMSKDGGESFSNIFSKRLNTIAHRPNRLNYWNLGAANDFIFQFRFWGLGRFVIGEGNIGIYQ